MRNSPVTGPWSLVTFFIGCVIFHLIGTWSIPLIDRDEPRFAEASREMIEGSDYVVPHFNSQLRLDKPPLAYWAQIASYRIFGENDFAARFPSGVAAALVAMSILVWGRQIGGDRIGWFAAIIFTLSLQTFLHAKAAVADMWLVLFVTTAHWAGWELIRPCKRADAANDLASERFSDLTISTGKACWLFYVSLALGFLAKGPIAWTPLLTIAAFKFFVREADSPTELRTGLAKRFKFVRGIVLMLIIVALWAIPALIQTHGEFLRIGIGRHVIGRSFGAMEGHGANSLGIYLLLLPFYFIAVFASFFPWSIKLPSLTKRLWRERDAADVYLLCGVGIIFIIFTLIKTKLPHYTLPAFPLMALLLARHIASEGFVKTAAIAVGCIYLAIALFAAPFAARLFPGKQLYLQARDSLKPEMEFGAVAYQEPSLVWYFRSRVRGWMMPLSARAAADFMQKTGPRFIILPTETADDAFPNLPASWKAFSASGFNIAKGKKVDLMLVLKPE
jgi:4-amino-4-deoxy-L-arabinose transferase-like glycosyltransferase